MTNRADCDRDVNYILFEKGVERYIIAYSDANRAAALRQLGMWARNPELSFTWQDAGALGHKILEKASSQ